MLEGILKAHKESKEKKSDTDEYLNQLKLIRSLSAYYRF